jgi:hypothetical protein
MQLPKSTPLSWSIEAFRPYMTYEVLQEAVCVLRSYDGNSTNLGRRRSAEMIQNLQRRTGLPWIADRKVQFGILFNIEGSVFRRMKRIFTSFYLLDTQSYDVEGVIRVTDFGKKLSSGLLSKEQFYSELIGKYSYPHPAYEENVRAWNDKRSFFPMRFIIETMFEMENLNIPDYSGIQVKEFAALIHPVAHEITSVEAAEVLAKHYKSGKSLLHTRTDTVDRKISDLFGFLVAIEVLLKDGNATRANPQSKVYVEIQKQLVGRAKKYA